MITVLRKGIKSKSYKLIMWATIGATSGIFVVPQLFRQGSIDGRWVGYVNGAEIDPQIFTTQVRSIQAQVAAVRQQNPEYADLLLGMYGLNGDPRTIAFSQLVRNELLDQVAHALTIRLSGDHIAEKFQNLIPAYVRNEDGTIDSRKLGQYLQHVGMSITKFEDILEKDLKRLTALECVIGAAYVPQFIVRTAYENEYLGKKFEILTLKAKQGSATPEEAQQELHDRVAAVREAAQTKSFKDLAHEFKAHFEQTDWIKSQDTEHVQKLSKDGMPVKQMLQIEKINAISDIAAKEQIYLVKLVAIEPFNQEEFNARAGELTDVLYKQEMGNLRNGFVASLYKNAKIKANNSLFNTKVDYSV